MQILLAQAPQQKETELIVRLRMDAAVVDCYFHENLSANAHSQILTCVFHEAAEIPGLIPYLARG